ncbi:site-2 protease family protein [Lentisphaerota bacterium WC36G]|nr:site-2 protease family protein [Lentisphaerae bacterium WC36]
MNILIKIINILPIALFAVFFFGFCVFIHELGHFLAAKWRGMHINAFSIGFKKAWGKKINGVDYRIGWLPFGGYVDLPQIDSSGEAKDEDGKSLPQVKPVDKIIVAAAGPFFNVLFGLFLGIFVWVYGLPQGTPDTNSFIVGSIDERSPEYAAGLRKGDTIVKLNDKKFNRNWDSFRRKILFSLGKVRLTVVSAGDEKTKEISYYPKANPITRREGLAIPFFSPVYTGVLEVKEGSPQYIAGLRTGDFVVKANGVLVTDILDLGMEISEFFVANKKSNGINLTVRRGNELVEIKDVPIKESALKDYIFSIGFGYSQEKAMEIGKLLSQNAKNAGFKVGDVVVGFNNERVIEPMKLGQLIKENGSKSCTITVLRPNTGSIDIKVTPLKINLEPFAKYKEIYSYPTPFKQLANTVSMTYYTLRSVFAGAVGERQSSIKAKNFSGPIGIFDAIFRVASQSWLQAIHLIVVISFSLAILNIMPFPVLDGGHIVVSSIQWARKGKPVPEFILKPIYVVFVLFIVFFFLFVTMNDILRLGDRIIPKSYDEEIQENKNNSVDSKIDDATAKSTDEKKSMQIILKNPDSSKK